MYRCHCYFKLKHEENKNAENTSKFIDLLLEIMKTVIIRVMKNLNFTLLAGFLAPMLIIQT